MRVLDEMHISAPRNALLDQLRANRVKHVAILAEARAGHKSKLRETLTGMLAKLEQGEYPVSFVQLNKLREPSDYTNVYDTAITMLELHSDSEVTLNATQVRSLVQDDWDWSPDFVASTSRYLGGS